MSVRFLVVWVVARSGSEALPPNTLVAAEMDEGGGGEVERWPWWAGASAAQAAAGVAWFRRGRGGAAFAMPFKAFAIATLFVGAGATAVTAGVLAAGVGSVDEMKGVGASIRRWMGAPPRRRVEGGGDS